ncbi:MAG: ABC transporter ATP-binding protein [Capsulimonadales bacterium]|nr:ABC transporter ATP-binding protein [Capsulimonadales bacterium]
MYAIAVENLTVTYPTTRSETFRAVDGVSFHVRPGEIVGFLGVNGAGKTSTIKALMGFQTAVSGQATLFDVPVQEADARSRVGFLPETALYSPYLTPFETLTFYGELHGMEGNALKDRIGELLIRVGLSGKEHVLNRTLSKGMQQRVGIAQALLATPRLLILDEVSSGLDPIGRRDLRVILNEERDRGTTIFFSSHQLSEVETVCDRVIVLNKGKLIAEHRVSDLVKQVSSLEDYFVTLVETGGDSLHRTAPESNRNNDTSEDTRTETERKEAVV